MSAEQICQDSDRRKTRSHSPSERSDALKRSQLPTGTTGLNTPNFSIAKNGKSAQQITITPFETLDQESASVQQNDSWYRDSREVVRENARIMIDGIDRVWKEAVEVVKGSNISFLSSKRGVYAFRIIRELNRVLCQVYTKEHLFEELPPLEDYKFESQLIAKVLSLEKENRGLTQKMTRFEDQIKILEKQAVVARKKCHIRPQFRIKIFKNQKQGNLEDSRTKLTSSTIMNKINDSESRIEKSNCSAPSHLNSLNFKLVDIKIEPERKRRNNLASNQIKIYIANNKKTLQTCSKIVDNTLLNVKPSKKVQELSSKTIQILLINSTQKTLPLGNIANSITEFVHALHHDDSHERKQIIMRDLGRIAKAFVQLINVFWQTMKRQDFRKNKGGIGDIIFRTKDFATWFNKNKDFCRSGTKTLDQQFTTESATRVQSILLSIQSLMS